jgi:hypothetical protein
MRRVHAHVERTVLLETETARAFVELRRRHAEVEQNPATGTSFAMCRDQCVERTERSASHHQARLRFEAPASGGNGCRVTVDREQTVACSERLEDAGSVTAATERCVDVQSRLASVRTDRKRSDGLFDKHRLVLSQ